MPSHANGYTRSNTDSTLPGIACRQMPWKPSQPATTSHASSTCSPPCVNVIAGVRVSTSRTATSPTSNSSGPWYASRAWIRSLTTSCWPYTTIERPGVCSAKSIRWPWPPKRNSMP